MEPTQMELQRLRPLLARQPQERLLLLTCQLNWLRWSSFLRRCWTANKHRQVVLRLWLLLLVAQRSRTTPLLPRTSSC